MAIPDAAYNAMVDAGRGYIYACTARAIGIRRVRVTHPLWLEADASIRAYEEAADDA